jgi:hypothetical protein
MTLMLSAHSAAAVFAEQTRVSSEGHEYELTCNQDGFVLSSLYPVARTVGRGAATQYVSEIEKLYLGRSCDAASPSQGEGEWCWANGGFKVDFAEGVVGFPRQELYCSVSEELGNTCICP